VGKKGDAIPYFRPPLEPARIVVHSIIFSASPTDFTIGLDARLRRRPQSAKLLVFSTSSRRKSLIAALGTLDGLSIYLMSRNAISRIMSVGIASFRVETWGAESSFLRVSRDLKL